MCIVIFYFSVRKLETRDRLRKFFFNAKNDYVARRSKKLKIFKSKRKNKCNSFHTGKQREPRGKKSTLLTLDGQNFRACRRAPLATELVMSSWKFLIEMPSRYYCGIRILRRFSALVFVFFFENVLIIVPSRLYYCTCGRDATLPRTTCKKPLRNTFLPHNETLLSNIKISFGVNCCDFYEIVSHLNSKET